MSLPTMLARNLCESVEPMEAALNAFLVAYSMDFASPADFGHWVRSMASAALCGDASKVQALAAQQREGFERLRKNNPVKAAIDYAACTKA